MDIAGDLAHLCQTVGDISRGEAMENQSLWGANRTYRMLWTPSVGAFLVGVLYLGLGSQITGLAIGGVLFSTAWFFVAMIGFFAAAVCREQSTRIRRLEEQLARLTERERA